MTDWATLQGAPDAGTPIPTPAGIVPLPNVLSVTFTVPAVVMVNARDALPRTATELAKVTVTGEVLVVEGDVVVPLLLHAAESAATIAMEATRLWLDMIRCERCARRRSRRQIKCPGPRR